MEQLKAQEGCKHESLKTFDALASVDLYRYDIDTVGAIRPETRQRVYDEELTYIAEGINRPLYTEFILHEQDGELVYFHEGKWRSYVGSLINNLHLAQTEARQDPRRGFMAERAAEDLRIGYLMRELGPGKRLAWKSEFPERESRHYGQEFVGSLGFQPQRKMGFIYEVEKTYDGRTILRTQSVDGNDEDAFKAAMSVGYNGTIEDMRESYDRVMSEKYGGFFYAGRLQHEPPPEENAWVEVVRNRDLIQDYYLKEIEDLALRNLPRDELEIAKKRLTYGVWAALKKRLDSQAVHLTELTEYQSNGGGDIQTEVRSAYTELSARGEVLFGCGGAIKGENAIISTNPADVFNAIFSKLTEKKWMGCPFCGARQYGDPCSPNIKCGDCSAEVKAGKLVSQGDGGSRRRHSRKIGSFSAYWAELGEKVRQEQAARKAREKIKKLQTQSSDGLGLQSGKAQAS